MGSLPLKFPLLCKEQLLLLCSKPRAVSGGSWSRSCEDPVERARKAAPAKEQGGFVPGMGLAHFWGWAGA